MYRFAVKSRAALSLILILLITVPSLLVGFMRPVEAQAQLTNRQITIGSSKASQTDVTYSVSVNIATGGLIKGIVVQFCNSTSGPIVGNSCTGPTGLDINESNLVVANQKINGTPIGANTYTVHVNSDVHTVILTNATGNAASAGQSLTFDLGSSGANDGITNPSTVGTFYARILTYSNDTTASAYADTTPGAYVDYGAVALSTANQLSVSARVVETLQFCVGTTDIDNSSGTIASDCTGTFTGTCGTVVNLGILDSGSISVSPVQVATTSLPGGGNNCNGAAMVRTNASNGVAVTYFAEQDTGSGTLKIPGAACTPGSNTDQCFNDSSTQGPFTAGTENFGVTVAGTNCNATSTTSYACDMTASTNKLKATAGYIGDTATAYGDATGFAWQDNGTPAQLASSTGPVDDETLVLKFAATPTITTPTGSYTVTSTYIATATF